MKPAQPTQRTCLAAGLPAPPRTPFQCLVADNAESILSPALPNRAQYVRQAVALDSPPEVHYWTSRFQASTTQIAHAVAAVGDSPARIDAWLRETRTTGVVRQDGKWTFLQSTIRNLMCFATGLTAGVLLG